MLRLLLIASVAAPPLAAAESAHRSCLESTIWAYDLRQSIYDAGDKQFRYITSANLRDGEIDALRENWLELLDASEGLVEKLSSICPEIELEKLKR